MEKLGPVAMSKGHSTTVGLREVLIRVLQNLIANFPGSFESLLNANSNDRVILLADIRKPCFCAWTVPAHVGLTVSAE